MSINQENKAGAALMACSIACVVFGLTIVISEASSTFKSFLIWSEPVGPLSGKVGSSLIFWLISWVILDKYLSNKQPKGKKLYQISLFLIVISFILTFPPFFRLFKG